MALLQKQLLSLLPTFIFILSMLFQAPLSHARDKVIVGVAHFPPFIINENGDVGGLVKDMLALMNAEQSEYEFVALPTLANTRHKIFDLGRYDMSMFDNLDWGWEGRAVDASDIYLRGGEIYITQALPDRGQDYFDDFTDKKMVGIEGYHYAFAGFNAEPEYLEKHFNMELTRSNLGSIQMILSGTRGDIAVVTRSFLAQYLNDNPEDREKLLLSNKYDQKYEHRIILRKNIKPTIEEINTLLATLKQNGKLDNLWKTINLDALEQ